MMWVVTSVRTNLGNGFWLIEPTDGGEPYVVHRRWWKRAINTVLRAVQGRRPWVIVTKSVDGDPPRVVGYGFRRVEVL